MKQITFIFVLISLNIFSQNTEKYAIEHLRDLSQNAKKISFKATTLNTSDKEKIFKKILLDTSFSFNRVINQAALPDSVPVNDTWDSAFIAQHYFIDIDNDNDLDVVFSGAHYVGSSEGNVDVYINKNEKYAKKLGSKGKLTFIGGKIDSSSAFVVYRYPYGNKVDHTIDTYICNKDKITLNSSLTFIGDAPAQLKEIGTHELAINTSMSPKPGSPDQLGSTAKTVKTNYYAEQTGKDGTVWRLVKLNTKDLQNVKNPEWKSILGWVK